MNEIGSAGVAPQGSTAAASALCDEVIADLGDDIRTHGPDCYRWHAGCLALRVRQALAPQDLEFNRGIAAIEREAAARALDALLAELSAPSNGLVHRCGGQEYIDTATLTAVAQGLMRRGGADAG